jgi:hypothetical protein
MTVNPHEAPPGSVAVSAIDVCDPCKKCKFFGNTIGCASVFKCTPNFREDREQVYYINAEAMQAAGEIIAHQPSIRCAGDAAPTQQPGEHIPFTRDDLLALHKEITDRCRATMEKKNRDYSGASGDTFANFRAGEMLGIPAELGILMRCLDKFQRIRAFVSTGSLAVKNESAMDAVEDVINYMVLIAGMMKEREGSKP